MAPKKKFSKEKIIDAAFEIAKTEGLDNITIRKVADKIGSSIAPIYVNFKDIDELISNVVMRIYEVSHKMYLAEDSGDSFKNMGAASIRFAKEYSVLFRDLLLKSNKYMKDYDKALGGFLVEEMRKDPDLEGFSDEELMNILLKMRIFQLGLSVMVANDQLPPSFNDDNILELLESAASDVIISTRIKGKNKDLQV
ncbi:TetR/AcrR family transcriptional regulator [Alkaliphilus pronyensis]|uniref:TetR/AcrR family transcriptional regulator n=1 Tax=Alkaliphilus pronyensis TaxID=1482732 RepID=A0A6I0F142_9FIRM|nr:TetR/AcrR family transcriptional regulator [Alkaliphilus pronyensis]KAB3536048.1 TetR/AcrR family transcriptional regulator [Alkaliphilus pronyensis]